MLKYLYLYIFNYLIIPSITYIICYCYYMHFKVRAGEHYLKENGPPLLLMLCKSSILFVYANRDFKR